MSWFYISNNEQKGPATDAELAELIQQGAVSAETQVWKEGMAEWKPYGEVALPAATPPPVGSTLGLAGGTCSECGQSFRHEDLIKIEGRSICGGCKPALVERIKEGTGIGGADEQTRQTYLTHERAVRSVGTLFVLGGSLFVLAGILGPFSKDDVSTVSGPPVPFAFRLAVSAMIALFGAAEIWVGLKLRKLDQRFRIPAAVMAGIGVAVGLLSCIGWIVPAYILWLLLSQKGQVVFSDQYARVIERTPHIKAKMWIVLKILLIVFGVLIALGILGIILSPKSTP